MLNKFYESEHKVLKSVQVPNRFEVALVESNNKYRVLASTDFLEDIDMGDEISDLNTAMHAFDLKLSELEGN